METIQELTREQGGRISRFPERHVFKYHQELRRSIWLERLTLEEEVLCADVLGTHKLDAL